MILMDVTEKTVQQQQKNVEVAMLYGDMNLVKRKFYRKVVGVNVAQEINALNTQNRSLIEKL